MVMVHIEGTLCFTNPTPMFLQEFPMFPGVEVDPIRAEQTGILHTPDTPTLMLDVTRFPLICIKIVIGRFVDTTSRAPLLTVTMLLNIRGGFAHRNVPGLLDAHVDMRQFMSGTDIGNSVVYQARVVGKGFDKSHAFHTQEFPRPENRTMIHT